MSRIQRLRKIDSIVFKVMDVNIGRTKQEIVTVIAPGEWVCGGDRDALHLCLFIPFEFL